MSEARGFIWYELLTPDAAAAQRFYGAVVGWSFAGEGYVHLTAGDGDTVGGLMQLTPEMQQGGARPGWLGYLHVPDVDAAVAAIEADGGRVRMPPVTMENVGRFALVTDPQGAPFYVMAPSPRPGHEGEASRAFSPLAPQHVRWNELATDDPDGAVAFYTRHFGWTQEGAMDMGPMGPYRFIQQDGVGIGAIMTRPQQMPASVWSSYIGVADIGAAARAIAAGGGTVIHGPMQIPGGEFSLNAIDPQGAAFGLVGPGKE